MAKSRNPIARILKYFTPKRFKDKKKYERKKYAWKKNDTQNLSNEWRLSYVP